MLPRTKRLSVPLFSDVLANGKILHSPLFTARILKTASASPDTRFSAVISTKIAKTSVERHKHKRRVYAALEKLIKRIKPGFRIILLAKPPLLKSRSADLLADLEELFGKNGLLK